VAAANICTQQRHSVTQRSPSLLHQGRQLRQRLLQQRQLGQAQGNQHA
jgi:hypothetical protein